MFKGYTTATLASTAPRPSAVFLRERKRWYLRWTITTRLQRWQRLQRRRRGWSWDGARQSPRWRSTVGGRPRRGASTLMAMGRAGSTGITGRQVGYSIVLGFAIALITEYEVVSLGNSTIHVSWAELGTLHDSCTLHPKFIWPRTMYTLRVLCLTFKIALSLVFVPQKTPPKQCVSLPFFSPPLPPSSPFYWPSLMGTIPILYY